MGIKKSDGGNDTFLGKHFYVVQTSGTMSVFYIVEKYIHRINQY